jgi:hypothetical protein
MQIILGPILTRRGGYAFDSWTFEEGLRHGYVYRRIEDAYYARNSEIKCLRKNPSDHPVACSTVEEFALNAAGSELRGVGS